MKTKVEQLIMIAGSSCVGKSTLIEKLQKGYAISRFEPYKAEDSCFSYAISKTQAEPWRPNADCSWQISTCNSWYKAPKTDVQGMIVHYDILGPFLAPVWSHILHRSHKEAKMLKILDRSDEITFLTLWAPPEVLRERVEKRLVRLRPKLLHWERDFRLKWREIDSWYKLRKKQKLYMNEVELFHQYDEWFKFCEKYHPKEHWLVITTNNDTKLLALTAWLDIKRCFTSKQLGGSYG